MRIAVVGATGAVGSEILRILQQRAFPVDDLVPIATPRSAGRKLAFGNRSFEVTTLSDSVFDGVDIALFDVPDDVSRHWAPVAARAGAVAVDNSAVFRLDADVPLVVPEINGALATDAPLGIVASPNCTTLAMVVPIAPLHRAATLRRLILASYQAASGAGRPGVDELWDQTELVAKERELTSAGLAREVLQAGQTFGAPLAMNFVPRCGSVKEDGYTSEELKLCYETRKILDIADLAVTATCVRVPVVTGHGVAVHAEFERPITVEEARDLLARAEGVELRDDAQAGVFPTALEAAGNDPCYVGRIRQDRFDDKALELFCVADNLRKGAALNTVQIAEVLADA